MLQVSEASEEAEKMEGSMSKALTKQIQVENIEKARAKAQLKQQSREEKLKEDAELMERVNADPILCEANDYMMDGTRRIRRDHFRCGGGRCRLMIRL
jgi:hypothetical protein